MLVGLIVIEEPEPIAPPEPQPPAYQRQIAPVPNEPPTTLSVTGVPLHTVVCEALTELGAVEGVIMPNEEVLAVVIQPLLLAERV